MSEGEVPAGPAGGPGADEAAVLEAGRRTLEVEARLVASLGETLGADFLAAVEVVMARPGRVVVTGMGKSGIVGHKLAATLASTGTPALFLHPAEAVHGDLGMITPQDVVLAISNSGETEEVLRLLPVLEVMDVPLVAMTSKAGSTLAQAARVHLGIPLEEEGCPIGLAPMASTTACLALGDALAAALMKRRGFRPEDFALFHPAGSLGRRLLTRVRDLMHPVHEEVPGLGPATPFREALEAMITSNLGAILVLEEDGRLAGLLTDGDIKRAYRKVSDDQATPVSEVMTAGPTTIGPSAMAERALRVMEDRPRPITVLPVVDDAGQALGLVRLHDILRAKIG